MQGYSKLPLAAKMRLPEQPYNFVERVSALVHLSPDSTRRAHVRRLPTGLLAPELHQFCTCMQCAEACICFLLLSCCMQAGGKPCTGQAAARRAAPETKKPTACVGCGVARSSPMCRSRGWACSTSC